MMSDISVDRVYVARRTSPRGSFGLIRFFQNNVKVLTNNSRRTAIKLSSIYHIVMEVKTID